MDKKEITELAATCFNYRNNFYLFMENMEDLLSYAYEQGKKEILLKHAVDKMVTVEPEKKSDQFCYSIFRLFWDETPVGFERWDGNSGGSGISYTTGDPQKSDGFRYSGWNGIVIPHNRKEILFTKFIS